MQRILNNPDVIVDEMLKCFLKAHSDIVEATENPRVVKAKDIPEKMAKWSNLSCGEMKTLFNILNKLLKEVSEK